MCPDAIHHANSSLKMDIRKQVFTLAQQILDASETELSDRELANKILELQPEWLPNPIYNPMNFYHKGQRVFHAADELEGWFTVLRVDGSVIEVLFDSGRKMRLRHNSQFGVHFPTTPFDYLLSKIRACNFSVYRKEKQIKKITEKYRISCFYRIDPIDNLPGILRHGLYCYNKRMWRRDISDQQVQAGRHRKIIPCSPTLTLHDCVPIFFAPKPPMLSARREIQPDIVYLHISPEVLLLPNVVFTDGNARNNSTRFYRNLSDLDKLDWDLLKARLWKGMDEAEHKENKRRRSAEILVPYSLSSEYIQSISVMNDQAYNRVNRILKETGKSLPVSIDPDLYYPMHNSLRFAEPEARYSTEPECPEYPPNWELQEQPPPEDYWS